MTDAQVRLKCYLYSLQFPDHANIWTWYNELFTKWKPQNRRRLEGNPHGVWHPDPKSKTELFGGRLPKVLKTIFKDERGVKWEK
jgi:hypothetical protein